MQSRAGLAPLEYGNLGVSELRQLRQDHVSYSVVTRLQSSAMRPSASLLR